MKIIEKFEDLEKANSYVAELNKSFADANEQIIKNTESVKELTKTNKAAATSIQELTSNLAAKDTQLNEALTEISELGQKLAIQEEHGSDGLIVSIGKKSYHLIGDSFIYNGETKTAKELSQDDEQLQKMLKLKSGSLVEISAS